MYYKKGLNITHDKDMFEFLKNHFRYDTMSSWNCLKSIANNVKLYNLNLSGDDGVAQAHLELDNYETLNQMLYAWEREHPNYSVGFNGRSDGYLVLYNKGNVRNVLPDYIVDNDYEGYKDYCKYYYGGVKYARNDLVELVKVVQSFDKLCDELRDYVNELSLEELCEEELQMLNDLYY